MFSCSSVKFLIITENLLLISEQRREVFAFYFPFQLTTLLAFLLGAGQKLKKNF